MLTLVARTRFWVQTRVRTNGTEYGRIAEISAASTKDVACNIRTLTVARQYQLAIRTSVRISSHLSNAVDIALSHGGTIICFRWVPELNILIIAGWQIVANGASEFALSTRVRLVPAFGEKDVDICTGSTNGLALCRGGSDRSHGG